MTRIDKMGYKFRTKRDLFEAGDTQFHINGFGFDTRNPGEPKLTIDDGGIIDKMAEKAAYLDEHPGHIETFKKILNLYNEHKYSTIHEFYDGVALIINEFQEDKGIIKAYEHLEPGDKIIRNINGVDHVMFRDGSGGVEYVEGEDDDA